MEVCDETTENVKELLPLVLTTFLAATTSKPVAAFAEDFEECLKISKCPAFVFVEGLEGCLKGSP